MVCTFFGHRYFPSELEYLIEETICSLIENKGVDTFYVGDKGDFDHTVLKTLRKIKNTYPHMKYAFIPAYQPVENIFPKDYFNDAFFPEDVLKAPRKYAIVARNRWMLKKADIVVTYVIGIGNARNFKELAIKRNKEIIELSECEFVRQKAFSSEEGGTAKP